MSRTYRRKNLEQTKNCSYYKQHNRLAEYVVKKWVDYGVYEYREATEAERFKQWYWDHGESRYANERGPGRWYRQNRMKENRSITKTELVKWIKNPDYEPMVEEEPRSHWWDWD